MTGWREHAACRGMGDQGDSVFDLTGWPKTDRKPPRGARDAVAICGTCPVVAECLAYADGFEQSPTSIWGVWGGMTAQERVTRLLRCRKQRKGVRAIPREKEGFRDDLSNDGYHEQDWAVSSTMLKDLWLHSAAYARHRQKSHKTTDHMRLGTAVHAAVLENRTDFVTWKDWTERGENAGRTAELESKGQIVLPMTLRPTYDGIVKAVAEHPTAQSLLKEATIRERSLFWREENGAWCRCRPDAMGDALIVDLKTIRDPYRAAKDGFDAGWPLQAAFYLRGARALGLIAPDTDFVFIAVGKEPPHEIACIRWDDDALEAANRELDRLIAYWKDCHDKDSWPGLSGIATRSLTSWQESQFRIDNLEDLESWTA